MVKAQKLVKSMINIAFFFLLFSVNRQATQLRIADRDFGKELRLCEPSKLARGSCESSAEGDKHYCDSVYRKRQKLMLLVLAFHDCRDSHCNFPYPKPHPWPGWRAVCEGYRYYIPMLNSEWHINTSSNNQRRIQSGIRHSLEDASWRWLWAQSLVPIPGITQQNVPCCYWWGILCFQLAVIHVCVHV